MKMEDEEQVEDLENGSGNEMVYLVDLDRELALKEKEEDESEIPSMFCMYSLHFFSYTSVRLIAAPSCALMRSRRSTKAADHVNPREFCAVIILTWIYP